MTHISDHQAYFFKIDTTIKKIRNTLQKNFQNAGLDLTFDQWVLIDHIYRDQGISQNTLAEMTYKDPPTITRIIDLLEKKDLVLRKPATSDRRKFNIYLTNEGVESRAKAFPIVVSMRKQGWANLSEEDYENFLRIIDVIYKNAN